MSRADAISCWSDVAGATKRPATRHAWLPVGFGTAAVLAQIVYPLVGGATRDRLTVLTVVLFAAAALSHAATTHGSATALRILAVFGVGGLAAEVVGVSTGFPFGTYEYTDRLGAQLAGVPVVIPLAWMMLGYPALVVARRLTSRPATGVGLAAFGLTTWDLFLDPQMVDEGYWIWFSDGPHLIGSIPVTNYLGWLLVSGIMMALLWPLTRDWSTSQDDTVPVALYLWTWLGSTLAHAAFFGLAQSAAYGFLGMGVMGVAVLRRGLPLGRATDS